MSSIQSRAATGSRSSSRAARSGPARLIRAGLLGSTALVAVSLAATGAMAQTVASPAGGGTITRTGGSNPTVSDQSGSGGGVQLTNVTQATGTNVNGVTINNTTGAPSIDALRIQGSTSGLNSTGVTLTGANTLTTTANGGSALYVSTNANLGVTINSSGSTFTGSYGINLQSPAGYISFDAAGQSQSFVANGTHIAGVNAVSGVNAGIQLGSSTFTGFDTGINASNYYGSFVQMTGGSINALVTGIRTDATGGRSNIESQAAIVAPTGIHSTNTAGAQITTSGAGTINSTSNGVGTGIIATSSGGTTLDPFSINVGAAIGNTTAFDTGVNLSTTGSSTSVINLTTTAAITATGRAINVTAGVFGNTGTFDLGGNVTGATGVYTNVGNYAVNIAAGVVVTSTGNGASNAALYLINGTNTVTNNGVLTASGTGSHGVHFSSDGLVTNTATGTISGSSGIWYQNVASVSNAGTITGTGAANTAGVYGSSGASVTNTGTITGYDGVYSGGNPTTHINSGTITGVAHGYNLNGGRITLTNSGTINTAGGTGGAGLSGLRLNTTLSSNSITNSGTITGGGDATYGFGVEIVDGAVTLTNQSGGVISGGIGGIWLASDDLATLNLNLGSTVTGSIVSTNSGARTTILAGLLTGGYDASAGTGVDTFTLASTGSITGAVNLGGGDDVFNWQGGTIGSTINAGSGTNDVFNSALGAGVSGSLNLSNLSNFESYNHQSGNLTLTGSRTTGPGWNLVPGSSLTLNGSLTATTGTQYGITMNGNGSPATVSILTGATLNAYVGVWYNTGGANNFSNAGTVTATNTGVLSNGALTATNSGTITAVTGGAMAFGFALSNVTNTGTLTGGSDAASGFGVLSMYNGATVTNTAGTISGGAGGILSGSTIYGGLLNVSNAAGAQISGPVAITTGGTSSLTLNNSGRVLGGTTGAIVANGSGAVSITNNAGGQIVSSGGNAVSTIGTATITNAGLIGTGTVSGGVYTAGGTGYAISVAGGAITNSGTIRGASAGIYSSNGLTLTNTGTISGGEGNVALFRDGVAVLNAPSTILNAGTISSQAYSAVLITGGTITNAAAGTLTGGSDSTFGVAVQFSATGGTFTNYGSATGTGAGAVRVNTPGAATTITLHAGSTTGAILLNSGNDTLTLYNGRGTGSLASVDGVSGITLQNAGTLAGASVGAINMGGGTNTLTLRGGGDGTAANGAAGTIASATVAGLTNLSKVDSGTWTLTGAGNYAGTTTVSAGTLRVLNAGNALGNGGVSIATGATLNFDNQTGGLMSVKGDSFTGVGRIVFTGNAGSVTALGNGGNGSVQIGLSQGGLIDVQSGTVNGSSAGQGLWTTNMGSLNIASGARLDTVEGLVRVDALTGTGTLSGGFGGAVPITLGVAGGSGVFNGTVRDATEFAGRYLAVTKIGAGTQALMGTNSYTGITTVSGGTLTFGGTSTMTGGLYVNGGVLRAEAAGAFGSGTIHTIDPTVEFAAAGAYANAISLEVAAGRQALDPTLLNNLSGGTVTLSGRIYETAGTGGAGQYVTFGGAGTTVLTNATNSWAGVTTIGAGVTLQGTSATISGGSVVNNGALAFVQAVDGTFAADISGTGGLTSIGAANLTLSGTNTYSGSTLISAGTLTVSGGSAISDTGVVTVAGGGTLSLAGSETIGSLVGSGTVRVNANTLTVGGDNASTEFSGSITDQAALSYVGSWNVTSGPNWSTNPPTYTGQDAAALLFGGGAGDYRISTAGTSTTTITDTAWYNRYGADPAEFTELASNARIDSGAPGYNAQSDSSAYVGDHTSTTIYNYAFTGGQILGGGLSHIGNGTLILSGTNTYTGLTNILAGTVEIRNGSAIADTGVVAVAAGAHFLVSGAETIGGLTGAGAVALAGVTLTVANGAGAYDGAMSGAGTLAISGGALTLGGSLTQAGGTILADGAVVTLDGTAGTNGTVFSVGDAGDLTISATGSVTSGSYSAVVMTGAGSSVINLGTITNTTPNGDGFGAGILSQIASGTNVINNGSATNATASLQGSFSGIQNSNAAGTTLTVNNWGLINGAGFDGIQGMTVGSILTVNNNAGGTISGNYGGVLGQGLITVVNAGTISSAGGSGIQAYNGTQSVTNLAGGAITGLYYGIDAGNGGAFISNAGTISGNYGVQMQGGTIENLAGGTISGNLAIVAYATLDLTNAGTLQGALTASGHGVLVTGGAGGRIDNQAGGQIDGWRGIELGSGATGMVLTNAGTISGITQGLISFAATGTGVDNTGTITGGNHGVYVLGTGSITNRLGGTLAGTIYNGVYSNGVGTGVANAGLITGGNAAIYLDGADNTVTNTGTIRITGGSANTVVSGVYMSGAGGVVTNSGTIESSLTDGRGVFLAGGTGSITNQSGGTISGNGAGAAIILTGVDYTVDLQSGSTVNGLIDASVSTGHNLLTLAGALNGSYAGGTGADDLTLVAGMTVSGLIDGGAGTDTLVLGGLADASLDIGQTTGFESRTLTGAGVWTLSGVDGDAADWTLDAGTLRLTGGLSVNDAAGIRVNSGATLSIGTDELIAALTGAGAVTIDTDQTLYVGGHDADSLFSGVIAGAGGLSQYGAGTLTLSGVNTYTGDTRVDYGTLRLGASDVIADASRLIVQTGATLDLQGFDETVALAYLNGSLNGTGTLTAADLFLNGASVNANLGAGNLYNAGGVSTLNGTSAAGVVSVLAGTLRLGASERLADTAILSVASGATLDLQGFDETVATAYINGTLTGASMPFAPRVPVNGKGDAGLQWTPVPTGTGTLTAADYYLNGADVFANLGTGNLVNTGGISILYGTAAADLVSVQAGRLLLGVSNRLADTATLSISSGATLDLRGNDETVGLALINGTLNGSLPSPAAPSGAMTLAGDASLAGMFLGTNTLTAAEYQLNGATVLANLGTGNLFNTGGVSTLYGTAAAGLVSVQAGTLRLGSANRLADTATLSVSSGAILDLVGHDETVALAYISGTLNGTILSNTDVAQVIPTLASTTKGEAGLQWVPVPTGPGTLTAAQYQLNGATINANLGTGDLYNVGGVSTLNGTAAAGLVSVQSGTLRLGASERLADTATLSVSSGATFDLNGQTETVGSLYGMGTVAVGAGRLTFGGAESAFGGTLSGSGSLVHTGGLFTLLGSHSLARLSNTGGELRFYGATTGAVAVSGGSLTGSATIGGALTVSGGATLSPGLAGQYGGLGTISAGSLGLNGGILALDVLGRAGGNLSDRLVISGTASLTGGVLAPVFQGPAGGYDFLTRYQFLTAGQLAGTFSNGAAFAESATGSGLYWRVRYDLTPNAAVLELRSLVDFDPGVDGTANQTAVGQALSGGQLQASDDWAGVLNLLSGLDGPQRRAAFDSLGGEALADMTGTLFTANDAFMEAVRAAASSGTPGATPLNFSSAFNFVGDRGGAAAMVTGVLDAFDPAAVSGPGRGGWISVHAGDVDLEGKAGQADLRTRLNGFVGGYAVSHGDFTLGGATGATRVKGDVAGRGSAFESDLVHGAGYARFDDGRWSAGLTAAVYGGEIDSRRTVTAGAYTGQAIGQTHGEGQSLSASVARRFANDSGGSLAAGLMQTLSSSKVDGFTETGAGALSLEVAGQVRNWQTTQLSLRGTQAYRLSGQPLRLYAGLGTLITTGDREAAADMRFSGAAAGYGGFTIEAAQAAPLAGVTEVGLEYQPRDGLTLSAGYRAVFSDRLSDNQVGARLSVAW
jgi:fibronectin-binding autotransporter adhesin